MPCFNSVISDFGFSVGFLLLEFISIQWPKSEDFWMMLSTAILNRTWSWWIEKNKTAAMLNINALHCVLPNNSRLDFLRFCWEALFLPQSLLSLKSTLGGSLLLASFNHMFVIIQKYLKIPLCDYLS